MPRKNNNLKNIKGGGCAIESTINVPCTQNVDVSVYNNPCQQFNKVGGGYFLDLSSSRIGGQAPVNAVFDQNPPIHAPQKAFEYPKLNLAQQTGGAYKYITNPHTGRKVRVDGKIGKQIIKNYINKIGGAEGLTSNFSADMNNRVFGCKQPTWEPNCV